MNGTIEWWTNEIYYDAGDLGYVMLQLPRLTLPSVSYKGVGFEPKSELHCSLLCVPKLAAGNTTLERALYVFIKTFIQTHAIEFQRFGNQLYLCEYEGARSIVVTAEVAGVGQLFSALREEFSEMKELPDPSLHVTLYKYNHRYGIGIQNEAERERLCRLIPETDLTEVRKVIYG